MLKQAILDAEALREVALKNAEAALLEKYSGQIKEAVEQLLEQPEDPLAPEQAPADDVMNMSAEPQVDNIDSVLDQVPMASTDGEKACPCPDENQTITLKLDQLEKAVNEAQRAQIDQLTENELFEALENEDVILESEEEAQEIDLDEDALQELVEKLTVDIHPQKSGWAGTPESEYSLAAEELLALEQDSEVREARAAMRKAVKELEQIKESLENKIALQEKELAQKDTKISELIIAVKALNENFNKVNLSNARLLYTNKALNSVSLNERQKNKIVNSISKAETVEEAKVIYETLQNAVGSTEKPEQPKSLSEVLKKDATSTILMSRTGKRETETKDPSINRWKTLAGLND
tara:strand:+ start:858 stop:1913 length:1056 start_codon:yes stop_codon:yes gene_type:complete